MLSYSQDYSTFNISIAGNLVNGTAAAMSAATREQNYKGFATITASNNALGFTVVGQ